MTCYVADIYIEDVTSVRTALSSTTLGYSGVHPMIMKDFVAREKNAILLINGDYAPKKKIGCVVKNGQVLRKVDDGVHRHDTCVLLKDGSMVMLEESEASVEKILAMDPWQTWIFGPPLLDKDGKSKTKFPSGVMPLNPRTAMGYYSPGHYCFVVVDGRRAGHSIGMTMTEISRFMETLGCASAYNLDGGGSTVMWLNGKVVDKPCKIRELTDVVYICEPEPELLQGAGAADEA